MPISSRRDFIQKISLGIGATAFLNNDIFANQDLQKEFIPEEKKLKVALVGLGYYATDQLAPALQKTDYCKLNGIVTGTPSKAEEWIKKYKLSKKNVYNYQNFDSIIDNKDIDVVYIVLPNSMHHEFVIRAAKAGKHVICEKPMSVSVKEAEEMIDACKKANKQLAIGYRLHFEPFTLEMARLGQKKVYGNVKFIEASFGFPIGDPNQWRMKKALAGGGPLMDVGIYAIQGCRYILGENPISVTAQQIKTNPIRFKDVEETLTWQFQFPSGAISSSTTTYASSIERLFASAEKGTFELEPAFGYGPLKGKSSEGEMKLPIINHQVAQLNGICKSIINNEPNIVPGEEGLIDMKIIEAIYTAMESGNKVAIKY